MAFQNGRKYKGRGYLPKIPNRWDFPFRHNAMTFTALSMASSLSTLKQRHSAKPKNDDIVVSTISFFSNRRTAIKIEER